MCHQMPSIETELWLAIKSRIATLPFVPSIAVAYPGQVYTPTNAPFIAVGEATSPPRRKLIGRGENDRAGMLTLVYAAKIGQDAAVYKEAAGVIAGHFAEDTQMRYGLTCVRVVEPPHVVGGYNDNGWFRTPVNIAWRSFR